jgi:hypothetical protein
MHMYYAVHKPRPLQGGLLYIKTYAFDAGSIHYLGKWEGVGPWKFHIIYFNDFFIFTITNCRSLQYNIT